MRPPEVVEDDSRAAGSEVGIRPFHDRLDFVDRAGPERMGRSSTQPKECTMGKTGRKRRARKKKGANHGKRPNA
jgi:hypothetical protein